MKTTSSINFYCKECKKDKNGYAPIQASIIVNGKRVFMNLPRKEKPSLFKKGYEDLNRFLDFTRSRIMQVQTELIMSGKPITAPALKYYMQNGGVKTFTLEDMFGEYLSLLKLRIGVSLTQRTFDKYITVRDEFYDFVGKEREAGSITTLEISKFYAHLNRSKKPSTTAGEMTKLKTIFKSAFENGKISALPFSGIRIVKPDPEIIALNTEEIRRIMDKDFGCDRLDKVRDLFIFQCASGLSYADMSALAPEDMKCHEGVHYIQKKRIKTGTEYTAIILPPGLAVFEKYGGRLPKITNQVLNRYIHEIGVLVGINKPFTDHTARKSYATFLLNSSMPLASVSKCLGHKEVSTTEKYYAKKLDETLFFQAKRLDFME